jgi:hypothetical protein
MELLMVMNDRPRYSGHTLAMCIILAMFWLAVLAAENMPW